MIEICDLAFYLSIALVFILKVTNAYKKSYSTTLIIFSLPFIIYFNKEHMEYISNYVLIFISSILLIRAIINTEKDKLLKRS